MESVFNLKKKDSLKCVSMRAKIQKQEYALNHDYHHTLHTFALKYFFLIELQ
jgi:hypothetical protein